MNILKALYKLCNNYDMNMNEKSFSLKIKYAMNIQFLIYENERESFETMKQDICMYCYSNRSHSVPIIT